VGLILPLQLPRLLILSEQTFAQLPKNAQDYVKL
jgi:hypothetical protein